MNCFFVKHYGAVTFDILAAANKILTAHENFRWDLNRLIDMTECSTNISTEDIRKLSKIVAARDVPTGQYRGAYVVGNALDHGIIRIFNAMVSSAANDYQIFDIRTPGAKEKALSWLELGENYKLPEVMNFS
ncbi:MAG: hypothetical protein V7750_03955 [Sneathiella sp.]